MRGAARALSRAFRVRRRNLRAGAPPLLLAAVVASACAAPPRPQVMSEVSAVRGSAAAREAETLAPQAHARAVQLEEQAEAAYSSRDLPRAQILSEQALAAFQHAFVLARLARAEQRRAAAEERGEAALKELADLDEQQQRVAAEARDIEMRIRVAQDAVPLVPNEPASPAREKARREAARHLSTQARLLCVATQMLEPGADALAETTADLDTLDGTLDGAGPAPIDEAIRLRSRCLAHLSAVRRAAGGEASSDVDQLLDQLGRAGLQPSRDDRGIVVTLRELFAGRTRLSTGSTERLAALGRVAKEHPAFPVLVVVHGDGARGAASQGEQDRGSAVAGALKAAGAPRVDARTAGASQPVLPAGSGLPARSNERVEIVFVAPAW